METLGSRLKKERKRLDFTQLAFAKIGGVESNAQGHYEKGCRSPKADYLQKVSDAGVDVAYLFTGSSSSTLYNNQELLASRERESLVLATDDAETTSSDPKAIILALHRSLSDTTDVIVSVAGCFSPPPPDLREPGFLMQTRAFRDDAQRFIAQALFKINGAT